MQYLILKWRCETCDRPNATEVSLDGTAKCDHCAAATRIQPSRARGGETPAALAAFIRAEVGTQQGERRPEKTLTVSKPAPQDGPPPPRTSFSYPFAPPPLAPSPAPRPADSRRPSGADSETPDEVLVGFLRDDR